MHANILKQQQMAATNASTGAQFPKPSYNSGYGNAGYDTLSQSAQDYNKGSYPGTGVGQPGSKVQSVSNAPPSATGTDMSTSMYSKNHSNLNKVNVSVSIANTTNNWRVGDNYILIRFLLVFVDAVVRETDVPLGHSTAIQSGRHAECGRLIRSGVRHPADVHHAHDAVGPPYHELAPADPSGLFVIIIKTVQPPQKSYSPSHKCRYPSINVVTI